MTEVKVVRSPKDDLYAYAQRVMNRSLMEMHTPALGLQMFGRAVCLVLDREEQFQAELCIFPPGCPIPKHEHPDVDSIEIQLTGSLRLFINGHDMMRRVDADMLQLAERFQKVGIRIPAQADHHVDVGEHGAVFLSVQRWKEGVQPEHIGHNWQGIYYSDDQRERLQD